MSSAVTSFWRSTKALACAAVGSDRQHEPDRAEAGAPRSRRAPEVAAPPWPAARGGRPAAQPFGEAGGKLRSCRARRRPSARLHGLARHEGVDRRVEAQLAARLREQMHRGRPAAGHADAGRRRARRRAGAPCRPSSGATITPATRLRAVGADDRVAGQDLDAAAARQRLGEIAPVAARRSTIAATVDAGLRRDRAPPHRRRRRWSATTTRAARQHAVAVDDRCARRRPA